MKTNGKVKIYSPRYHPRHWVEGCGQFHALAALTPKSLSYRESNPAVQLIACSYSDWSISPPLLGNQGHNISWKSRQQDLPKNLLPTNIQGVTTHKAVTLIQLVVILHYFLCPGPTRLSTNIVLYWRFLRLASSKRWCHWSWCSPTPSFCYQFIGGGGESDFAWYVSHHLDYCTSPRWEMINVEQSVEWVAG
jgi:hypothetical protein